ncbi:serine peptidase [Streptomyces sp. NPDC005526]|uniref:serine peptidase n=1 Tax=Streptomyces sp. NPDC005526 TaxID=3156885 RepID=UPI0033B90051
MSEIVGVHGVGNYAPGPHEEVSDRLSSEWGRHLARLVDGASHKLRVAYYAPFLRSVTPQSKGDGLEQLPENAQSMVRDWALCLEPVDEQAMQGHLTLPLRMVVDRIARIRCLNESVLRPFVATFFWEVAAYLRPGANEARTKACRHVARTISEERPRVVVAHSLGSVVAYEALWTIPDVPIDLLLTLGSPLGMPRVVFDRLTPSPASRGQRPPGVRRWVNIVDPGDVVAIPRPLGRQFELDQDIETAIGLIDFHTAAAYLSAARTSEVLAAYFPLAGQPLEHPE